MKGTGKTQESGVQDETARLSLRGRVDSEGQELGASPEDSLGIPRNEESEGVLRRTKSKSDETNQREARGICQGHSHPALTVPIVRSPTTTIHHKATTKWA